MSLPDQFAVFAYFPDPVKGYGMGLSFRIEALEGKIAIALRELHGIERYGNDFILDAIIVSDFEAALGEFLVPTDPAEQFLDRFHGDVSAYRDFSGQAHNA